MLVVGLIDIQHMQSVVKGFCLFCFFVLFCFVFLFFSFFLSFKNCYYFSDLETQWPRNPELPCRQQLSEGVSHNIEEKKSLSSVSELFL